jgi:DnaJ like chaperone protein
MSWNGKIIGAALGLWVGGPVGAALGLLVGHQFDAGNAVAAGLGPDSVARVQELYFPAVFRVMGHVAKADGRVSEQEIAAARAVMTALRLDPGQVRLAIAYFGEGKQPGFSLDGALAGLRPLLRAFPQLAQFFIEIQLQAALAGNGLSALPRARLLRAANYLGLTSDDFARLEALMRWRMDGGAAAGGAGTAGGFGAAGQRDRLGQAYTLLETAANSSDEQVVKAYRRQMSRNHPDKLQANGLPESMLERAKERTQQIQAAYELIRSARGMR